LIVEFEFGMKFKIGASDGKPEEMVERLGKAGCDDAAVGIGQPGRVALDFAREARSIKEAMIGALRDVRKALPAAELIEVTPDFVGLTDVAEIVGVSRQNMRKLMLTHPATFPAPVHEGSASVWHLAHVLRWLNQRGEYSVKQSLLDIATMAMQINLVKEAQELDAPVQKEVRPLVAIA
jgi:predicted DNA-binding transcriptional regulator AlpA